VQTLGDHYGTATLYIQSFDLRSGRRARGIPSYGIPIGGWLVRPDGTRTFGVAELAVSDAGGLAWHGVGQPTLNDPPAETMAVHDASGPGPSTSPPSASCEDHRSPATRSPGPPVQRARRTC
jgi:hypothetical protein